MLFVHIYLHLTIVHARLCSVYVCMVMFVFHFNCCRKMNKVMYKELIGIKKINTVKNFCAGKITQPAVPTVDTNILKSNVFRR